MISAVEVTDRMARLAMSGNIDIKYPLQEQRFAEDLVGIMRDASGDRLILVFGHIAQDMIGVLTGSVQFSASPYGIINREDSEEEDAKKIWSAAMEQIVEYCSLYSDGVDVRRLNLVMLSVLKLVCSHIEEHITHQRINRGCASQE